MLNRTFLGLGLLAVTVFALCAAGVPQASSATRKDPATVSADAQRIDRFASAAFPDHFTGVAIGREQRSVIVYRKPSRQFDQRVRDEFPGTIVTFAGTTATERELTALSDRVVADMPYWRTRGVNIRCVGPSPAASAVTIGVDSDLAAAASALKAHYGHRFIRVEHCDPRLLPMPANP